MVALRAQLLKCVRTLSTPCILSLKSSYFYMMGEIKDQSSMNMALLEFF